MEDFNLPSPERVALHENINTMEDFNLENINTIEDFNLPSPERVALLERLQEVIGNRNVTPHFWATCQICNLGALEKLLLQPAWGILLMNTQTSNVVRYWGSSPGYQSRPPTPKTSTPQKLTASDSSLSPSARSLTPKRQKALDSPTTLPRDANVKKRAEERDKFSCVLTGIKMIEVAHIYPHYLIKQKEEDWTGRRHQFWSYLSMFWSEEKVTAWEAKLFPQGIGEKGVEEVYNLISLSPCAHTAWGRGLFALKPISESDDKKTLIVQFFWQEKQIGSLPEISLTTTPISTQGLEQTAGVWLFNKNGKKIQSGDCFELQTDDPIQKPLPSFELLELQWALHRIQGMAGAADVDWEALDSDNEIEEVPSLDNDVEDFSLLSKEPLCSPAKPNHPYYPKHGIVEVEGDGDKESDFVM